MSYFLAVDLGTSAVKTALFDENGARAALAIEEYPLLTPGEHLCEVPAAVFWEKFKAGLAKILGAGHDPRRIAAVSFSSQGETFVPLDQAGRPLRNVISWLDNRSLKESEEIEQQFGRDLVYETTGQPAVCPTWTATKILWLRRNEPDVFEAARKYVLAEDYLIYRLSGRFVSEYSVYSSSLVLDISRRTYWADMLEFLGLSEEHFPELVESARAVGTISAAAAAETGLSSETLVVTGAYDHAAGSIGSGVTRPGVMSETTGSAMAICSPVDKPTFDPLRRVPCHCHALEGKYFLSPFGETAGMVLKWFRDRFCETEAAAAAETGKDTFEVMGELAAAVPPGSEGLVMLPFLSGTGAPEFDPRARGVFSGITLKHTKGHFIRAIMESVAFMIRKNVLVMQELGVEADEMRCLGGGAKSPLWCQIKADVLQKPVATLEEEEQALKGAAILAGVGAGCFNDVETASHDMVKVTKRYAPCGDSAGAYASGYETYTRLYEDLKEIF